jgi:hypothetical protein
MVTLRRLRPRSPRPNANGQDDTPDLAPNGAYILLSVIGADSGHKLVINGHGAAVERDASVDPFRILQIGPGANLTVNDMTIAHGKVADFPSRGGGIYNNGSFGGIATLTVTNSTFSGSICIVNGAQFGGKAEVEIVSTVLHASLTTVTNAFGTITSSGYNLSSDGGGGFLT